MAGAFIIGALSVVQSRINGELGQVLQDGILAAFISFSVGLAITIVVIFAIPRQRATLKKLRAALQPGPDGKAELRRWQLLGGLGGATFVAAQGISVQYLGVAIFTVAVVAAQNANSLVVDRLGIGPSGVQPISAQRVFAAVVATIGVAIAVTGRLDAATFSLAALILALVAGAAIAVQQAVIGRVALAAGSSWTAGFVNFIVGWIGLGLALAVSHILTGRPLPTPPAPWSHPILWIGGFIGLAFILVTGSVIHTLGVLLFALLTIAGQMTGALVVDLAWPQNPEPISWALVIGVLVTGAAVALATASRSGDRKGIITM